MRKKKIKLTENPKEWYNNLSGTNKRFVQIGLVVLVLLGLIIIDIPIPWGAKEGTTLTGLPSLLVKNDSRLPSLLEKEPNLPHLITFIKRKEYPITLDDILCDNIFRYGIHNMTLGHTSCFSTGYYNFTSTDYDCVCYTTLA